MGSRKELEADVRYCRPPTRYGACHTGGMFPEICTNVSLEFEIQFSECLEDILHWLTFRSNICEEIWRPPVLPNAKSPCFHLWLATCVNLTTDKTCPVAVFHSTQRSLNLNATICRTGEKCKGLMKKQKRKTTRKILEECGGKISRGVRMLHGCPTLYKKMERYGLR